MSSSIVVPSAQVLGNYPPAIQAALITGLTQAQADVNALQGDHNGVANLAALSLIDTSLELDGVAIPVATLRHSFVLDNSSTATPDGITILATLSGTSRWLRDAKPAPHWSNQLTWYVDAIAGAEENAGDSGHPVASLMEVFRRVRSGKANVTYTINVTGNIASTDNIRPLFAFTPEGSGNTTFLIQWVQANASTGLLTGSVGCTPATNTQAQITPSVSVSVGDIVTATSGAAAGATAVVAKDIGAGAFRVSTWVFPLTGVRSATPAPGDAYAVKTYPTCAAGLGGNGITPSRLVTQLRGCTFTGANSICGNIDFIDCRITTSLALNNTVAQTVQMFGCSIYFASLTPFLSIGVPHLWSLFDGAWINGTLRIASSGVITSNGHLFQGCTITPIAASFIRIQGGQFTLTGTTGIYDAPAGKSGIVSQQGMRLTIAPSAGATALYGSGNNLFGAEISEGASWSIPPGCTPTITGGSGDLSLDGMVTAYQQLELQTGALAAAVVVPLTTWAQFKASVVLNVSGFAGNVLSYKTGARITTGQA